MNISAMRLFLSEDNIKRHLDHLNTLKLRFSILEKSDPRIIRAEISDILQLKIDRQSKLETIKLLQNIRSHELYFNSFSQTHRINNKIKQQFTSRESMLYEAEVMARTINCGFIYIYINKIGKIEISSDAEEVFINFNPILALDMYEHSYFLDYGFKKDKYIRAALSYFDTDMIK